MGRDFVAKGEDCNCWDRVRYSLPCPCVISRCPRILPWDIVHERWRFESDGSMINTRNVKSTLSLTIYDSIDYEEFERENNTKKERDNDDTGKEGKWL